MQTDLSFGCDAAPWSGTLVAVLGLPTEAALEQRAITQPLVDGRNQLGYDGVRMISRMDARSQVTITKTRRVGATGAATVVRIFIRAQGVKQCGPDSLLLGIQVACVVFDRPAKIVCPFLDTIISETAASTKPQSLRLRLVQQDTNAVPIRLVI